MKKDQYEIDFEQHRKEITVDEESDKLPSRTEIHKKKKNNQRNRTKLINIILAIFTLIPILILLYVLSDLYSPAVPNQVPVEKTKVSISRNTVAEGEKEGAANSDKSLDKQEASVDSSQKSAVIVNPDQPVEKQKEPSEQKVTSPKTEPVKKPEQKPEKPVKEEKPVQEKPAQNSARHHVVKSNETLYRISVNYYGDGSHVQKIQQANGLSSNNISVGQTLILP